MLLILGLNRSDLEAVERKLSGFYMNVTSKAVTLVMPIREDRNWVTFLLGACFMTCMVRTYCYCHLLRYN